MICIFSVHIETKNKTSSQNDLLLTMVNAKIKRQGETKSPKKTFEQIEKRSNVRNQSKREW